MNLTYANYTTERKRELKSSCIKPKNATSEVWKYFGMFDEANHPTLKGIAMCYKCLNFFKTKGSTSSLKNHMNSQCMSDITSGLHLEEARQNYNYPPNPPMDDSNKTPVQRKITSIFKAENNGKQFQELSVKWVCERYQPFSSMESESFKDMISCLDPKIKCSTSDQVKLIIDRKTAEIQAWLGNVLIGQYPSLTTDIWKDLAGLSYQSLTIHWIDDDCNYRSALLDVHKIVGSHTGENIATTIKDRLVFLGIPIESIIMFTTDTAKNIVAAFKDDTEIEADETTGDTVNRLPVLLPVSRNACVCHLGDLVSKVADTHSYVQDTLQRVKVNVNVIRKSGPLSERLRDLCVADKIETTRIEKAGETRWWSVLSMCLLFLIVWSPLNVMYAANAFEKTKVDDNNILTLNDYKRIGVMKDVLGPLATMQQLFESESKVNISLLPYYLDRIQKEWDLLLNKYKTDQQMERNFINDIKDEFARRFGGNLPFEVYTAALLDPRTKRGKGISQDLRNKTWNHIKSAVTNDPVEIRLYNDRRLLVGNDDSSSQALNESTDDSIGIFSHLNDSIDSSLVSADNQEERRATLLDEVDREIIDFRIVNQIHYELCPLEWWRDIGRSKFPLLWRLFKKVASIQVSSAASERIFSATALVKTKLRNKLSHPYVCKQVYLAKNWSIYEQYGPSFLLSNPTARASSTRSNTGTSNNKMDTKISKRIDKATEMVQKNSIATGDADYEKFPILTPLTTSSSASTTSNKVSRLYPFSNPTSGSISKYLGPSKKQKQKAADKLEKATSSTMSSSSSSSSSSFVPPSSSASSKPKPPVIDELIELSSDDSSDMSQFDRDEEALWSKLTQANHITDINPLKLYDYVCLKNDKTVKGQVITETNRIFEVQLYPSYDKVNFAVRDLYKLSNK